ncbi:hypothetical protein SAMN04487761_1716, partial [Lachnospiraceae bacterium C7]
MILTNRSVTDNNTKLMTLVSTMQENDIAALVFAPNTKSHSQCPNSSRV